MAHPALSWCKLCCQLSSNPRQNRHPDACHTLLSASGAGILHLSPWVIKNVGVERRVQAATHASPSIIVTCPMAHGGLSYSETMMLNPPKS